jgi:hypothetical protein
MTIEVDLKEIKSLLSEVNSKLDSLLEEKDTYALMALEENPSRIFLKGNLTFTRLKTSRQRLKVIEGKNGSYSGLDFCF